MFVNVTVSLNFVQNSEVSNKKVILFNRQDLLVSVADQQNSAELCFYTVSCGNPDSTTVEFINDRFEALNGHQIHAMLGD